MNSTRLALLVIAIAGAAMVATAAAQSAADRKTVAKPNKRVLIDRVVAIVNNAVILNSELTTRVGQMSADLSSIRDAKARTRRRQQLVGQVLDEMIGEELVVQAAIEAKLEVKPAEITAALDEIKKQNKLDDAGLARALAEQGTTLGSYRKEMRRQILRLRAVNSLVRPKITVTDEDVRALYDAQSRRSGAVSSVKLHHILLKLPEGSSAEQVAAVKAKAADIISRARAGEPFKKLAAEFSQDDKTKNDGGELGWIERGSIATEWEVVVFAMSKNEVRGPISGPSGLHVFHVSDLKKAELKPFEELKEKLRNDQYRKELDRQSRTWLEELRKKAHVQRLL